MESVLASLWGIIAFAGFVNALLIPKADGYISRFRESAGEAERRDAHRWGTAVRVCPVVVLIVVIALSVAAGLVLDASLMDLCLLSLGIVAQAGFTAAVRYLVPATSTSLPNITLARGVDWRRLRSQYGTRQTVVRFINQTEVPVKLNWVDWEGQLQDYGTIQPGRDLVMNTYLGHPFLLRSTEGRDVAVVEPLARPAVVKIRSADLPDRPCA
ncbi:hypothetical protein ABZ930_23140 [Streptomyces sp. NPDC046716]|uniref:VHL beta domain-containing protein n=1 Tax=Streptomyces sp. NPDC046716 TaxID=3157093 RepID=UPI003405315F